MERDAFESSFFVRQEGSTGPRKRVMGVVIDLQIYCSNYANWEIGTRTDIECEGTVRGLPNTPSYLGTVPDAFGSNANGQQCYRQTNPVKLIVSIDGSIGR